MTTDVQYQTGKMVKEPRDMTTRELADWHQQLAENARDYLFSIGQPVVYKRPDGQVVAEHKDGRVLVVQ